MRVSYHGKDIVNDYSNFLNQVTEVNKRLIDSRDIHTQIFNYVYPSVSFRDFTTRRISVVLIKFNWL